MDKILHPGKVSGVIRAISSKSDVHRLLICAALSDAPVCIRINGLSEDIEATARCLTALGAKIHITESEISVAPICDLRKNAALDCGESGSTLRFLLPVCCALGADAQFLGHGRLPERPLSPLYEQLQDHGITLSPQGKMPLSALGQLAADAPFTLAGNVSSQYVSGLLMALTQTGGEIVLTTRLESKPYVDMTIATLRLFGAKIDPTQSGWIVHKTQLHALRDAITAQGDWSNAAFFLCAGALTGPVTVRDLDGQSPQGDKQILDMLQKFGAAVQISGTDVTVSKGMLSGCTIDVSDTPDLAPILCAVACAAKGTTRITGAKRLRIKESDRLETVRKTLSDLGADIAIEGDDLVINGGKPLFGGVVDAFGDHRIAMTAAVAASLCESDVTILGAQAVSKSYPAFFEDYARLAQ